MKPHQRLVVSNLGGRILSDRIHSRMETNFGLFVISVDHDLDTVFYDVISEHLFEFASEHLQSVFGLGTQSDGL